MRKVVFMIDGWFMRKQIYKYKTFYYSGQEIRNYCLKHLRKDDYLYRIFYYDTEPLDKKGHYPISKKAVNFGTTRVAQEQTRLLNSIKTTPNFALRLGKTIWRNNQWILKPEKVSALLDKTITTDQLVDEDFKPLIEQKAVDIKLGLDITCIAMERLSDLLVVITGDADIVPVLKFARRNGMQVCLDPLRNPVRPELSEHVDFIETQIPAPKKKS
ncbi:MAG: NYN domain-containing protein [Syntrophorhabdaceae bacterium]|nr:NYN domain-containing protein [Syntrophorhabdaceae bacterium]